MENINVLQYYFWSVGIVVVVVVVAVVVFVAVVVVVIVFVLDMTYVQSGRCKALSFH